MSGINSFLSNIEVMSYLPCFQEDGITEERFKLERELYSRAFAEMYLYLRLESDHSRPALRAEIARISREVGLPEEELNETIGRTLGTRLGDVPRDIEKIDTMYGSLRVHFSQLAYKTSKLRIEDWQNYRDLVKFIEEKERPKQDEERKHQLQVLDEERKHQLQVLDEERKRQFQDPDAKKWYYATTS